MTPNQVSDGIKTANDAITECVQKLLLAFDARLFDIEAGTVSASPPKDIGEINIVVDQHGEIDTARLLQYHHNETYRTMFLRVKTAADADAIDHLLLLWALDVDTLRDVIMVLQPKYAKPEWRQYLETATKEISVVLSNATIIEPTSPRHALLRGAAKNQPAENREHLAIRIHEVLEAEQNQPEIDDLITEYIGVLLDRYDERLEDTGNDPNMHIGAIHMIIDDGTIAARLNKRYETRKIFLLALPTEEIADTVEKILASWSNDYETLEDVIRAFRPAHPDPEFYAGYIEQAIDEVANVLFGAIVVPTEPVMLDRIYGAVGCC